MVTNLEHLVKYDPDLIIECLNRASDSLAIDISDGDFVPCNCGELDCKDCYFNGKDESCDDAITEWLTEEYTGWGSDSDGKTKVTDDNSRNSQGEITW